MHSSIFLVPAADPMKCVASAGVIVNPRMESLGQPFPNRVDSSSWLGCTEEPPDPEILRFFPGQGNGFLDQVFSERRSRDQSLRLRQQKKINDSLGAALNAHRHATKPHGLNSVREREPTREHAERKRLKNDVSRPQPGSPVFPSVHFIEHLHVMLGERVKGRHARGA